MLVIWHLAISNWRIKRVRLLLVVLAVAAGSLITSAAGTLISSLGTTLRHNLNLAVQNVDLTVRPAISSSGIQLPASTLEKINALQQVALCEGRITAYVTVDFNGHTAAAEALAGTWHNQSQLRPLTFVSGSAPANPQEVAIDDALANRLSLHTGDRITLAGADSGTALNVSGIAASSDVARIVEPLLCYVSIDVLHRIDRSHIGWTQIDVKLRPQSNIAAVAADLQQRLGPSVKIQQANQPSQAFNAISTVIDRLYLFIGIPVALCEGLLVLAVMTVGLRDRIREFGRLRCLGATRGQLLQLVFAELNWPVLAGIVLGGCAGIAGAWLVGHHYSQYLGIFSVGPATILITLFTGVVAGAIGSLAPLVVAWRAEPMAALAVYAVLSRRRRVWPLAVAGVLALLIQIALWQVHDLTMAIYLYVFLGLPLLVFAAAAFAPPLVLWTARPFSKVLGRLWSVDRELLSSAWSRSGWGVWVLPTALLVVIAFFVFIESRGAGLLASWEFPVQFPDAVVFSPLEHLPTNRLTGLDAAVPGIAESSSLTAFWVQGSVDSGPPRRLLFVAVEPRTFADMIGVQFNQGDRQSTLDDLQNTPSLLIAPEARSDLHLAVGSKIALATDLGVYDFRIAGVVDSLGVRVARNYLRVGEAYDQVADAVIIGSVNQAGLFFGLSGVNMVMLKVKPGYNVDTVMHAVKDHLNSTTSSLSIGSLFGLGGLQLQAVSVNQMKQQLNQVINRAIRALGFVAIALLSAGSFGAAALIAAVVRNRRYEFGLLRALGAGRGQLIRLVLAELSMVIFFAVLLGSLLGLYLAFLAVIMDRRIIGFNSEFVPSWPAIIAAALICAGVSILAATKPASGAAFARPGTLIAAGRE